MRVALIMVLVVEMFARANVPGAHACSCFRPEWNDETARVVRDGADAVVVGLVEERRGDEIHPVGVIERQQLFKGSVPAQFGVTSDNCNGIVVDFREGERWVMNLSKQDGEWRAHGCSSWIANSTFGAEYVAELEDGIDTAGPMWPVIVGLGGFGAGAGLAFAIWRIVRRRDFAAS